MRKLRINVSGGYDVLIGSGLLLSLGEQIAKMGAEKACIVSDDNVFPLYGDILVSSLADTGVKAEKYVILHGERSKNLNVYASLMERMRDFRLSGSDVLIALGGGVVGYLGGFAASTYHRGIPLVQIPTSLLACVDSSVGGKTALNLPSGKNQLGTFYQPSLVICDIDTLHTLPTEEYRCGSAEIIKYAILESEDFLREITDNSIGDMYEVVISRCVDIKRRYVEADEFDRGKRMLLNFGHTLGHAIEAESNYSVSHGCAVAAGMGAITSLCVEKGICSGDTEKLLLSALDKYSLPSALMYPLDRLLPHILNDKKSREGKIRFVLLSQIGNCFIHEIHEEELDPWLRNGGLK